MRWQCEVCFQEYTTTGAEIQPRRNRVFDAQRPELLTNRHKNYIVCT